MRTAPSKEFGRRERQIMDVVYRLGRATVGDVMGRLPDPPTYSAVRAMLRYLERKGHLRHTRDLAKIGLLGASGWLVAALLARGPASARHDLWLLVLLGAVLVPAAELLLPPLYVIVPATWEPPRPPLALWALGALVWAARLVPGLVALSRVARTGERWHTPAALDALSEAARLAGVTRPVLLLRSSAVPVPATWGVRRPVIALPAAAATWTPELLRPSGRDHAGGDARCARRGHRRDHGRALHARATRAGVARESRPGTGPLAQRRAAGAGRAAPDLRPGRGGAVRLRMVTVGKFF